MPNHDFSVEIREGIVYVTAQTPKGVSYIKLQHSNNVVATLGGAKGLDISDDTDSFDETLLAEEQAEWQKANLTWSME